MSLRTTNFDLPTTHAGNEHCLLVGGRATPIVLEIYELASSCFVLPRV